MYKNGLERHVCIDDYFVTKQCKIVYAKANDHVTWVPLVEKAYAKVHGSFKNIEGGKAYEAMRDLTGAPAYLYDINQANLAQELIDFNRRKYMMVCNSDGSSESEQNLESLGLKRDFSYGILDVQPV